MAVEPGFAERDADPPRRVGNIERRKRHGAVEHGRRIAAIGRALDRRRPLANCAASARQIDCRLHHGGVARGRALQRFECPGNRAVATGVALAAPLNERRYSFTLSHGMLRRVVRCGARPGKPDLVRETR